MQKVLIVITTDFVPWGGLTTVAMNYYRAMDKTGLQIDFASVNKALPVLLEELATNGSRYLQLPDKDTHPVRYVYGIYRILRQERYDVIHIHGNSATMLTVLFPAWLLRVKKRIVHVHSTQNSHRLAHAVMKLPMNLLANVKLAVSEDAGRYLYGNRKFEVLRNAIDTRHYQFNWDSRVRCRREWGIPDSSYVIGTVGKMNAGKNQLFLLDVFMKILERCPTAKLLIVGDGVLRQETERKIGALGIGSHCILTGMQMDTANFLSAMDVFVFPSKFEGLPLALVEAQAAGLPCYVSDNVPKESAVTEYVDFIALDRGAEYWGAYIYEKGICSNRTEAGKKAVEQIAGRGYDIAVEGHRLRNLYMESPQD